MATIVFDTLKFARALREKAHLTTEQAEGFAEAITDALHDDLATKSDLRETERKLETGIEATRADLRETERKLETGIEATRADLRETEHKLETGIEATRTDLRETERKLEASIEATRADLRETERRLQAELKTEIAGVHADIEIAKRDLKIWLGSIMVVAVGVILAAIRYLPAGHS